MRQGIPAQVHLLEITFPQGLKPSWFGCFNVRAEARTLQARCLSTGSLKEFPKPGQPVHRIVVVRRARLEAQIQIETVRGGH